MSLFNMLAGVAGQLLSGQLLSGQQNSPVAAVAQQLLGAGAQGGNPLEGLLRQFQQAGLGETMQSWIGSGQNLPISADALAQVLGRSRVDAMAQAAGIDGGHLLEQLARMLPQAVDGMTPQGSIPDGDTVQALIGQLFRR